MNITGAQRQMRRLIRAGEAVLLISGSGMGKSSICLAEFNYQKAEGAKKGERWGLGIIFAATQTPPDLIGYQFKGERTFGDKTITVTEPSCPLWMISVPHGDDPGGMPAFMYDKFFLIIDEYGQGEADTKRALAEIFLKGGTAPWYLPPGSVRVAATNEGSRYGVTKDFDFCIARRCQIKISPDIEPVLTFMDKPYYHNGRMWQTTPVTKFFAKRNPQIIFEGEPKEQGPFCNPRTMCDADRYLQEVAADCGGLVPSDDPEVIETMSGIVGMPATVGYMGDLAFRTELPQYEDVVADPDATPIPSKPDLKMLMTYEMAHMTQESDLAQIIKYITRKDAETAGDNKGFPSDMAMTYVTQLMRRDYKTFINAPAMQGWISKNAVLLSLVSSLAHS